MAYEGQGRGGGRPGAGTTVRSLAVRGMQAASLRELRDWLPRVVDAVRAELSRRGDSSTLVNGGGTGSLARTAAAGAVTSWPPGPAVRRPPPCSDTYRRWPCDPPPCSPSRRPPARARRVIRALVGTVASGPAGRDRLPRPVLPAGLRLTGQEGPGEVQTPSWVPRPTGCSSATWCGSATPRPGSRASGSATLLLVEGGRVVDEVPTYRGEGKTFL